MICTIKLKEKKVQTVRIFKWTIYHFPIGLGPSLKTLEFVIIIIIIIYWTLQQSNLMTVHQYIIQLCLLAAYALPDGSLGIGDITMNKIRHFPWKNSLSNAGRQISILSHISSMISLIIGTQDSTEEKVNPLWDLHSTPNVRLRIQTGSCMVCLRLPA